MDEQSMSTADALEMLHLNQIALRAAVEEVSTRIRQRGSVSVHANVMTTLETLDVNADCIASAIERLRK